MLLSACLGENQAPDAEQPVAAQGTPAASADDGQIVTIGFAAQSFERQAYEPIIKAFNEQNPDVRVQFIAIDEVINNEQSGMLDAGQFLRQIVSAADTAATFFAPQDKKVKIWSASWTPHKR
jgi:ABC-type glycerol-3-phosphate transport system substrate-binding protein